MGNWLVMDNSGKPPADASPTPCVVITKVNVLTKSTIANTLPNSDAVGCHGFITNRSAVTTTITPSFREKSANSKQTVEPPHEGTMGHQGLDVVSLVGVELENSNRSNHNRKSTAGNNISNRSNYRLSIQNCGTEGVTSCGHRKHLSTKRSYTARPHIGIA
jgi:hypothetical protein